MNEEILWVLAQICAFAAGVGVGVLWATRRNLRAGGFVQVPQLSSSVPFGLSSPMFRTVRFPPLKHAAP